MDQRSVRCQRRVDTTAPLLPIAESQRRSADQRTTAAHHLARRALRAGVAAKRTDSKLRPAAGEAGQLPPRRRLRWGRLRVAIAVRDSLGLVRVAPLGKAGHLVRDLDVAAFSGVPRDAARSQGRGRPALPLRHQPADRPRLAVLAARGKSARPVDVLRRRCLLDKNPWWPVMPDTARSVSFVLARGTCR